MVDEFTLNTSAGDFALSLRHDGHAEAVTHFGALLSGGHYVGSHFFRVVPGFLAQAGCPNGDGSGGFEHATLTLSSPAGDSSEYRAGAIGLGVANGGLVGSQFFVFLGDWTRLPPHYPIVAEVAAGIDTIRRIEAGGRRDRADDRSVVIEAIS